MTTHEKSIISTRYFLIGRKYYRAIRAMELALKYHTGFRKDGKTPEFSHQLTIFAYLRTLENSLLFPEETFAVAFLHDLPEDYDYSFAELENQFGKNISDATNALTKKYRGSKVDSVTYFDKISACPIASVVKGADRIHNFSSMVGVFTTEKQIEYIKECETNIIPALKKARRNFPEQEPVYENIKLLLRTQIQLIGAINEVDKI